MPRGLSVELVVQSAIELADESGLSAVTMAAVAKRCGFTTMSLYRHVASKDELVRRMLDVALGTAPALVSSDWRAGLDQWSRAMLAILDEHPWGIDVPITGMLGTHAQLSWLDRGLEAMAGTTLDDGSKAEIVLLLNGYVFWAARLRFQVPEEGPDVIPPDFDMAAYPSLARAVSGGIFEDGTTPEDDFVFGLERVLDGVEALISRVG
ncbi:TetR/AcrR family transcriptional regulator [Solirubrobacter ginsenosidimutans]|uniref:TetR/AcrR family transcriptional regulator n=1 Tax=Solirubrobacter ginsenosidimutans TaxID=490573 RepID=A0A9X3MUV6_9ACTN|nr:TetR/AcrR family transcriptional regulator [Solirubrobacter ginsenosidimutans]MDA0162356.1 TetR/AcrR family transcriptional regulator [Solirubrobacter ginsenosidimutans]